VEPQPRVQLVAEKSGQRVPEQHCGQVRPLQLAAHLVGADIPPAIAAQAPGETDAAGGEYAPLECHRGRSVTQGEGSDGDVGEADGP